MKVHWLQSDIRQTFLTYRFYNFPLLFGNKPIADVYLSLNDPHSFMLIQVLSELESRFNLTFRLYLVTNTTLSSEVDAELLNQWALKDANFIAQKYGLMTVSSFPEMKTLVTGQQTWLLHGKTVKQALKVFVDTWSNNFEEDFPISTPVITAQINNQRRMFRRGYYTSGAIFFCGNWFSGVDRLEYLERLLNEKGLSKEVPRLTYTKNNLALSDSYVESSQEDAIQAFISLDSPFAYLGLVQAKRLSEHYKIPLEIKPLVSMDMRGGITPEHKQRYMLLDAIRVAQKHNILLKEYAKPVTQGVINIYSLFTFAELNHKSYELILAALDAIYISPVDLELGKNIKQIFEELNLDYDEALEFAKANDWQQWSEENYLALTELGLWGVPCFKYKGVSCWGQDRLVQIEDVILAT